MKFSFKQRFCPVFKDVLVDPQDSSTLIIPATQKFTYCWQPRKPHSNEPLLRLHCIQWSWLEASHLHKISTTAIQPLASLKPKFHLSIVILPSSFCTKIGSTLFSLQFWMCYIKH